MLQYFKNFLDFFVKKKDSFLLFGICFIPIFSIFRIIFKSTPESPLYFFGAYFTVFLFSLQLYLLYLLLFQEISLQKTFSFLVSFMNKRFVQQILFCSLLLEQLFRLHSIIWIVFVFNLTYFFIILYENYPELIVIFQILLIFVGVYMNFRRKLLGEDFLLLTGINESQPVSWKKVIEGINLQLFQIKSRIMPSNNASINLSRDLIQNRWTNWDAITFPFFFYNTRRNMTFRAAAKSFYETIVSSFSKAPLETTATATTVIGSTLAGGYAIIRDQQQYALNKHIAVQNLEQKEQELFFKEQELFFSNLKKSLDMAQEHKEHCMKNIDLYLEIIKSIPSKDNQDRLVKAQEDLISITSEVEKKRRFFDMVVIQDQTYTTRKQLLQEQMPAVFGIERANFSANHQSKDPLSILHLINLI